MLNIFTCPETARIINIGKIGTERFLLKAPSSVVNFNPGSGYLSWVIIRVESHLIRLR